MVAWSPRLCPFHGAWNVKNLSRISDLSPETFGHEAQAYLTYQAANAVEPGWTADLFADGRGGHMTKFMNTNVPEYSAIRQTTNLSAKRLANRVFDQVRAGAVAVSGSEDILASFLRVRLKRKRQYDLRYGPDAAPKQPRPTPRPKPQGPPRRSRSRAGKRSRPYDEAAAAKKISATAEKKRQLILSTANLVEPRWALVRSKGPNSKGRDWVFVNFGVTATSVVRPQGSPKDR